MAVTGKGTGRNTGWYSRTNRGSKAKLNILSRVSVLSDKTLVEEAIWRDWFFPAAGPTGVSLASTEAADTASLTVAVVASLSSTEGSDTAAFTADPEAVPMNLAATEAEDTAASQVNVVATVVVTEASDSASANVNVTAALATTEESDVAAFISSVVATLTATESDDTVSFVASVLLDLAATEDPDSVVFGLASDLLDVTFAATEDGDTANAELQQTEVGGGGGLGRVIPFSARSGLVQEKAYKRSIAVAKRAIKAAQKDPLLARESEFKKLLSEAYRAFQELAKLQEIEVRNRLMAEYKRMREIEVELAMRAEEEEDMALLAATLW